MAGKKVLVRIWTWDLLIGKTVFYHWATDSYKKWVQITLLNRRWIKSEIRGFESRWGLLFLVVKIPTNDLILIMILIFV